MSWGSNGKNKNLQPGSKIAIGIAVGIVIGVMLEQQGKGFREDENSGE